MTPDFRQSIQIARFGAGAALELRQLPREPMSAGHVRIAVQAAGVNFADLMMRMGTYPEAPPLPFTPGYEIAGTVTEVGAGVSAFTVGNRVLAGCRFGGYTTEIVLPVRQVRLIPKAMSFEEAATLPVNFMTAWVALEEMARVRANDRVLIPSAAGGVGIAALQIAMRRQAQCTALVGSASKRNIVSELGANRIVLQKEWDEGKDSDFGEFDVILDATGGASLKRAYRRLAQGGRVINYGVSGIVQGERRSIWAILRGLIQTPLFTPFGLMMANRGVFGLNMLKLFDPQSTLENPHDPMARALDAILAVQNSEHPFRIIVGKTFPLQDAAAAHAHLLSRQNIGKVILTSS